VSDPRAKSVIETWNRLDGDRGTTKTHWQQICDVMLPDRADYTLTRTPGQKRMWKVFDSTPIWCVQQFSSGLHSLLTSSTLQWFWLQVEDENVNRLDSVRAWLDFASAHLYAIFNSPQRNFASQSNELYQDIGTIGTAVMAELESARSGILFSTRHLKECVFAENEEDRVDMLTRRWKWTAKQAVAMWKQSCSPAVLKAAMEKPETEFAFLHQVKPRADRNPDRSDNRHKPFESLYVDEAAGEIMTESGFDEFPYHVPRWTKLSGEINGRGQGAIALPDVKMLNELMKLVVKAAQKVIDPPLDVPDDTYLLNIKTVPGSLNMRRRGTRPDDRIAPIVTGGRIEIGNEQLESLRNQIKQTFFVDIFRMPTDLQDPASDGKGITATYWLHRREKEMMALSPMLARMSSEFSYPLINRTFNIEWRKSKALNFGPGSPFPPPPPELSGAKLRVEYVSPMALAQKSSEDDAIDAVIRRQLELRQLDPESPLVLDNEAIMRLTSRNRNAPAEILKTAERMNAEAEAEAEAKAEAARQAQITNIAGAAKDGSAAVKNLSGAGVGAQQMREAA
jgi:hypothetical protein